MSDVDEGLGGTHCSPALVQEVVLILRERGIEATPEQVTDAALMVKRFREMRGKHVQPRVFGGDKRENVPMMDTLEETENPAKNTSAGTACYPPVLDVCCGPRGMWFDKRDKRALFTDRRHETIEMEYPSGNYREEIHPDMIACFTDLPFPDDTFWLVVMDPPHIQRSGADGRMTKRYGFLSGEWREMLRAGFAECFRVLKPNGTMVFKWCEVQFPIADILRLAEPQVPLFGHRSGKRMNSHWVCFMKSPAVGG